MTTAQDIIDDISADLTLGDGVYDAQILRAIKSALRELRGRRYWFLKSFGTLTTTANSETLSITTTLTDFSVIKTAELVAGTARLSDATGFELLDFQDLRARHWNTATITTGQPVAYAVENNTMYFSHKCTSAYTVYVDYYKQDAALPVSGASTSVWFDDGYDVIKSMAQYIFKRDAQGMTANEADADMVAMALLALDQTHERKVSGRG